MLQDIQAKAMTLAAEQNFLEAAELFFRFHEETILNYREAKAQSDTSVATRAVVESLEISDETRGTADAAMVAVRTAIFDALMTDPNASVLLYEALRDYASEEVKDYRDDVIRQAKRGMTLPEAEDAELPELSTDELLQARTMADSFWRIAGAPNIAADEKDHAALHSKKLKSGEYKLAFSNLPKNVGGNDTTKTENDPSVTTARLRYAVDGKELEPKRTLNYVALWGGLSSADWTVTAADIKSAVKEQTGKDYSDVGDFEVTVNGHTLRRWRENI